MQKNCVTVSFRSVELNAKQLLCALEVSVQFSAIKKVDLYAYM